MPRILAVEGLTKRFGGIAALNGCSFVIDRPGIYGLIGPNGAGKTTFFDVLTGRTIPDSGSIRFEGREVIGRQPFELHRWGISRTFQECRVFPDMTCLENLLFSVQRKGMLDSLRQLLLRDRAERLAFEAEATRLLAMVTLDAYAHEPAAILSYGQKRLLETVSAFLVKPQLALLDEPTSGVNPALIAVLKEFIRAMFAESRCVFMIVEHNMEFIMGLSDHVIAMHQGAVLEEGAPTRIQASPAIIEAYLG